jgi:hypothetical protein
MKIEYKIDQNRGDRGVSHVVHRGEKTLDFDLIPCYEYHLYSSEGQWLTYIYVHEGENIQKNPREIQ